MQGVSNESVSTFVVFAPREYVSIVAPPLRDPRNVQARRTFGFPNVVVDAFFDRGQTSHVPRGSIDRDEETAGIDPRESIPRAIGYIASWGISIPNERLATDRTMAKELDLLARQHSLPQALLVPEEVLNGRGADFVRSHFIRQGWDDRSKGNFVVPVGWEIGQPVLQKAGIVALAGWLDSIVGRP
jgi:hypothetical protein